MVMVFGSCLPKHHIGSYVKTPHGVWTLFLHVVVFGHKLHPLWCLANHKLWCLGIVGPAMVFGHGIVGPAMVFGL